MKSLFKLMTVLAGLLLYVGQSEAACYYNSLFTSTTNIGSIVVQRDVPIGTTIATAATPYPSGQQIAVCSGPGYIYDQFVYLNKTPTGIANVYATNIPGVGISFGSMNGGYFWSNPPNSTYYNASGVTEAAQDKISLVKTGPITSGVLQAGMVARSYTDGDGRNVDEYYLGNGSVTQLACSITTPNVDVRLAPVLASSFTAVNSTKGDTPFTIGLTCDAGARINASLSFTQNSDTANNSVIKLTGAGTAGVATGVGIQLLYGGTLLKNNTNVVLKTSTGGVEFPAGAFTARYFQTKSTVTTGDANATATLNLTYQ
ncbi:Type-1A pilin [Serratia fonticola]|uniref:fimbrial protein n=1 Tax=Serratia fonticola TaxID=47917 RepID=UPI001C4946DD|nr:fimbrial protein [Serratia fonticola]QXN60546.1 fimbrial protein [Serratia fonticola]CAI1031886.1 Type-1A pilin [Serratia fonticola]